MINLFHIKHLAWLSSYGTGIHLHTFRFKLSCAMFSAVQKFCRKLVIAMSHFVLYAGLWFFALIPIAKSQLLYALHAAIWLVYIVFMLWHACFYEVFANEYSLNGSLTFVLFITQMFAHFIIIVNSFEMRTCRKSIQQRLTDVAAALAKLVDEAANEVQTIQYQQSLRIMMLIVPLIICHIAIISTVLRAYSSSTKLYWRSFLSALALQFKMLEFLDFILHANCCQGIVYCVLNRMGEQNLEEIFQACTLFKRAKQPKLKFITVRPIVKSNYGGFAADEESIGAKVFVMKHIYSEFFGLYKILNDGYGWSLLVFTMVYFTDFVSNSYYIFLAVITQELDISVVIQNGGFVVMALILLSGLCAYCQQSDNYFPFCTHTFSIRTHTTPQSVYSAFCSNKSRKIGCLICKLVKPLGNKRYNDLVTEFSLQTLHQRFVVTAKDFFALNLNLLGGMVAAIVTYLVILIQFMFTEKNNKDRATINLATFTGSINTSTTTASSIFADTAPTF